MDFGLPNVHRSDRPGFSTAGMNRMVLIYLMQFGMNGKTKQSQTKRYLFSDTSYHITF